MKSFKEHNEDIIDQICEDCDLYDDLVITEDLTRYGRSMVLMLVEINKLLEMGIRIKTLDGSISCSS